MYESPILSPNIVISCFNINTCYGQFKFKSVIMAVLRFLVISILPICRSYFKNMFLGLLLGVLTEYAIKSWDLWI